MANEEKDGLFSTNLGDGLIDIPDTVEDTTVVPAVVEEPAKVETSAKEDEPTSAFKEHEDGTIEIDEALQATINAGQVKADEDNGTNIENTESTTEKDKSTSNGNNVGSDPVGIIQRT